MQSRTDTVPAELGNIMPKTPVGSVGQVGWSSVEVVIPEKEKVSSAAHVPSETVPTASEADCAVPGCSCHVAADELVATGTYPALGVPETEIPPISALFAAVALTPSLPARAVARSVWLDNVPVIVPHVPPPPPPPVGACQVAVVGLVAVGT